MSETLVIRLRAAEGAPASWLIVDANGSRSGPVQSGPLADALGLAQERSVVLLLPGSEVTLAEPELPLRGGARLAQAVPYALEEQLASDVEGLHFAVGDRPAGASTTPVAVVARTLMDRWLGACEAAGLHPRAAYADCCALPATAGGSTLLLDESALHVRRAGAVPFVLDADPLGSALELALGGAGESAGHVTFYTSPSDYERHRETIEGVRGRTSSLQVKLLPDGALPLFAAQSVRGAGVNLLQGPYAAKSSLAAQLRRWRVAAALAAAAALLFVLNHGLAAWQLSRTEKKLDAEIAQVFAQAMPGQKMVNPREQMQGMLGEGSGRGALLPVLSALAKALAGVPQARVDAISFRGAAVELRLTVQSVQSLESVRQALSSGGLNAQIQSTTPRGQQVDSRLLVTMVQT